MKTIYMIGGAMGVGKTTVCQLMKQRLPNSVFLDGDWCWDAHPFQVTDETKEMVLRNICFLLDQFIRCSAYDNIIFCWVMHEQSVIDRILAGIDRTDRAIKVVSLIASEASLRTRLMRDVAMGVRTEDAVERSVQRIPCYARLNTVKILTDGKDPDSIADEIMAL